MSQPVSRPPPSRSSQSTKEPVHLPLHRRLLFPTHPPNNPLPVLVPGDTESVLELNEKLYGLIALCLRAYVLSWLPRITRDRSLLPHIHNSIIVPIIQPILAHLSAQPESIIPLIIYDLPAILTLHFKTYWQARDTVHILPNALDAAYHAHLPLLAAAPSDTTIAEDGRTTINQGQYVVSGLWLTSMADAVARKSLKDEEYRVTVQRTMVREIIGRVVLGGIARRLVEPAWWWSLILRFLPPKEPAKKRVTGGAIDTVLRWASLVMTFFWTLWTIGTNLLASLSAAPPAQFGQVTDCWVGFLREALNVDGRQGRRNWALRLGWGSVEAIFWFLSPITDRLVPHLLGIYVLQPKTAIWLVDLLERFLFPLDGFPAPTPPDPSPDEIAAMRRLIEERLSHRLPAPVRSVIAPTTADLQAFLDPLSDAGCNAHLMGMLYTTVFATLVPDLVVTKPADISPEAK